jgi:hypothetical protein
MDQVHPRVGHCIQSTSARSPSGATMKPSAILAWHGRAPRFAPGLRNAIERARADRLRGDALLAKLQVAVTRDARRLHTRIGVAVGQTTQHLDETKPDAEMFKMFEEVAMCAMSVRMARREPVGHVVAGMVEQIIGGHVPDLTLLFEPDLEEGPCKTVAEVFRELQKEYEFCSVAELCIQHAIDFADNQWVDQLSNQVPLMIDLIGDDLFEKETAAAALFASSTLLAFRGVRPVPSPAEEVTLLLALREQAPGANQEKLASFLKHSPKAASIWSSFNISKLPVTSRSSRRSSASHRREPSNGFASIQSPQVPHRPQAALPPRNPFDTIVLPFRRQPRVSRKGSFLLHLVDSPRRCTRDLGDSPPQLQVSNGALL